MTGDESSFWKQGEANADAVASPLGFFVGRPGPGFADLLRVDAGIRFSSTKRNVFSLGCIGPGDVFEFWNRGLQF
ncbi:hypothetical protein [Variovorax sp. PDC80]|uniref:hypothetical protein n=1 Tax=Variovorax sp. PDC80 TaxID=1882827 RepID=UPI001160C870|nr:hypothetical protein [Variovorax sp. PDC80]